MPTIQSMRSVAPVRRNSWLNCLNPEYDSSPTGSRYRMSALEKSKSRPLTAFQSRAAVIEVSVAPPNHGVVQFTSALMPLSEIRWVVSRLLQARRASGSVTRLTPSSEASRSTMSPVMPRTVVTAVQQFSSRLVESTMTLMSRSSFGTNRHCARTEL